LRQAYDYWQNQPGNYRAPGTANCPCFRAEEFSSYGGQAGPEARRARAARPACAGLAAGHIRFPLLNSPERRRRVGTARKSELHTPPRRPKRRPDQEGSAVNGVPSWEVPPVAFERSMAIGQSSTEPTLRHTWGLPLCLRAFPDAAPGMAWAMPRRAALGWFSLLSSTSSTHGGLGATQEQRCMK